VTTDELSTAIARSPIFRGVSTSLVSAVAARCQARVLASGETLLTAGSSNDRLYLVLSGSVRVRLVNPADSASLNPSNLIHVRLGPGECVGELSILDGRPVSTDVIAEEATVLISFDRDTLWALIEASRDIARNLLRTLAGRIRHDDAALAEPGLLHYAEQAGMVDSLTGLRGRQWLDETFPRQLERSARTAQSISLLLIDIDHFTQVNKERGRAVSDELLRHTSRELGRGLRPQDLLARYGGGMFAVLLPGLDLLATIALAERLRLAVEASTKNAEAATLPPLTVSIGGTSKRPYESLADLLKRDEESLERAKQAAGNHTSE